MVQYRLYFLTPQGRMIRRETVTAEDDAHAIAVSETAGEQCVVELWLGGTLVKRWNPTEAS